MSSENAPRKSSVHKWFSRDWFFETWLTVREKGVDAFKNWLGRIRELVARPKQKRPKPMTLLPSLEPLEVRIMPVVDVVDKGANGFFGFSSNSYSVQENAGAATISVVYTPGANDASTVSVNYSMSDGTAVAGCNYIPTQGTLSFTATDTTQTFAVPVIDALMNEDETVDLILTNPTGGTNVSNSCLPIEYGSPAATLRIINDDIPPQNTVPGTQGTNKNMPLVFSAANGNAISISDPYVAPSVEQVTLTAVQGTLTLSTTTNLSFDFADGNGTGAGSGTNDATMTFRGSIADINAALDGFTFTPSTDYNGSASVEILTNDLGNTGLGGPLTAQSTVNIVDPPVLTLPSVTQKTGVSTPLVFSQSSGKAISIADPDAGTAVVQVSLTATNGTIALASSSNLTFSAGTGTNDASMTFTGTLSDINTALDGLVFVPTSGYQGNASLDVLVNDLGAVNGSALTAEAAVNIAVVPVNTLPGPQSTTKNTPLVFSAANGNAISISNVGDGSSQGAESGADRHPRHVDAG